MPETASPYPSPETQSTNRYRDLRQEVRRAGSAFLDASMVLHGEDYRVVAKLCDVCDYLLVRLLRAERRAA